jgi:hypothetical protein
VYRLLGKLIVGLTGFFLLLSLTARALGNTQPPNPALRGFIENCEDKPQPCWYGIVPGVTKVEEASAYLLEIDYVDYYDEQNVSGKSKYCDVFHQYSLKDRTIIGISLQNCRHIDLGLLINELGSPNFVTPGGDGEIVLTFKNRITVIVRPGQQWLSPDNQAIWFIIIGSSRQFSPPQKMSYQWHGFNSYDYYKRMEANIQGQWYYGG